MHRAYPLFVASLLFVACIASVIVYPGTDANPDLAARADFIRQHLVVWRIAWSIVLVAMIALTSFMILWARTISPRRVGLTLILVASAISFDAVGLLLLIFQYPQRMEQLDPFVRLLAPILATSLYSVAGAILTNATKLGILCKSISWTAWTAGGLLSIGAIIGIPVLMVSAAGTMWALMPVVCVMVGRQIAGNNPSALRS